MLALGRAVSVTATGAMERYVTVAISKLYVGYTNGAMDCYVTVVVQNCAKRTT